MTFFLLPLWENDPLTNYLITRGKPRAVSAWCPLRMVPSAVRNRCFGLGYEMARLTQTYARYPQSSSGRMTGSVSG